MPIISSMAVRPLLTQCTFQFGVVVFFNPSVLLGMFMHVKDSQHTPSHIVPEFSNEGKVAKVEKVTQWSALV